MSRLQSQAFFPIYEKYGFWDTGKRLEAAPGLVLAFYEKTVPNKEGELYGSN